MSDTPANAARPARVLVVDDHPAMAETLADDLAGRGFDAVPVASGREEIGRAHV